MDGAPEGTAVPVRGRRRPKWQLVVGVAFAAYLTFRLIEALVHLIGSL